MKSNSELVKQFIKFINEKNLDEMFELLGDKHIFVDSMGNKLAGIVKIKKAWRQYFEMVPDYHIEIEKILIDENFAAVFGTATGSVTIRKINADGVPTDLKNNWQIPAAWKALIENERISLWQVYADNEPIRRILNIDDY